MMDCIGTLTQVSLCWVHHSQLLITFCICMAMQDHQNQSCSRYRVHTDPGPQWCLLSSLNLSVCLSIVRSFSWHPSIHGSHSMNHRDKKPQNFFQLTSQSVVMVEGSLVEHQPFPLSKDSLFLPCVCIISQQMLKILYFLVGNPHDCSLRYWIFLLSGHIISHM